MKPLQKPPLYPLLTISCCIILIFLMACSKTAPAPEKEKEPAEVTDSIPEAEKPTPTPTAGRTFRVGSGSGALLIDGNNFKANGTQVTFKANDTIRIKKGSYSKITIQNIQPATGVTVVITNDGLVELAGEGIANESINDRQMKLINLAHVKLLGNGSKGISYGFLLRNYRYRAIQLAGNLKDFELSYFEFKDLGDNVIGYDPGNTIYNGAADSYAEDLKFTHLQAENIVELIDFRGWINKDGDQQIRGLIKGIEVAHIAVENAPKAGTIVNLHNAQNFDIHHVVLKNINTERTDHVGIFTVNGPGKIHHNLIQCGWGNAVRAFPVTLGSQPGELAIYNNIIVNSIKYSAFEVQPARDAILAGKTTYIHVKIYNNTCGNLSMKGLVIGKILDAFDLFGGTYEVFNNLAFNFPFGGKDIKGPFVSYLSGDANKVSVHDNLYFDSFSAAGIVNETSFQLQSTSPAKNNGKKYAGLTNDYYGTSRGNTPSIGAVQ